ncbi:uncharacterized protein L201_007990 [Kwoniella dendrophila CBS 6074]|uniref:Ribosome assembly protein 3 n=1 Tax=Kwoniella dendrophila CBS 6074 TaxID=1295534 RepID=A0AAX4K5P1_9TREE
MSENQIKSTQDFCLSDIKKLRRESQSRASQDDENDNAFESSDEDHPTRRVYFGGAGSKSTSSMDDANQKRFKEFTEYAATLLQEGSNATAFVETALSNLARSRTSQGQSMDVDDDTIKQYLQEYAKKR